MDAENKLTCLSLRARAGCKGLLLAVAVLLVSAGAASANEYSGMLAPGNIGIGGASASSGGFVYGDYSWTAPGSTNFNGFAYTAAAFSVVSDNSVGGVSVGFGGDGSANQPNILFPWTDDCSITNTGHYWTNSLSVAGTSGKQTCSTAGNTSGWNYSNAELDNTAPTTNPQSEYHTLWFTAFCQAGTCNYDSSNEWGSGSASVVNLSANIDDPNNQPSITGASWTGNNGASWYQTDSNSPSINASASDPAGVCAIGGWLTGPGSYYVQLTNSSPGLENPGNPVGNEFESITPCPGAGGGAVPGSATLPANLASGTYNLAVVASNPGNWEANTGLSNAPTIANYNNTINVDDTVPSINWSNTSGAWTSSTSERFTVTAGPSGTSHVSCTDNGIAVAATLVAANTYSVPTTTQGANNMSCTASNGDANGALTSGAANQTYDVDTTTPTLTFTDTGYAAGTWANSAQTVSVSAAGGPSGLSEMRCFVDSGAVPVGTASLDQVTISGNGQHVLECTAVSNTNISGEDSYDVWVDTRQPTVGFAGAQPAPTWLTGTPTVIVVGSEQGGVLSGITKLTCSVNSGSPFVLNVDAALQYTNSFVLTPNGADTISCQATNATGTTGPASTETVNLDNPVVQAQGSALTQYGSSPEIDNGADPYTDGPSEKSWYHTPEAVTITAVNSSGGAAIGQIDCTGAALTGDGTYPANTQNAYGSGGERITVTVQPPGGDLSCTAQDTAGNSYPLGSYEFEIDNQAPTGYFVPEDDWPEPGEVQLRISDGAEGSGTAAVEVTAQNNNGRLFKVMATRDSSTPDVWDAYFDDSTIPPGLYTFVAYPTDVADNSTTITTNQAGTTETLPLPFREMTSITDVLASGSNTANGSEQVAVAADAASVASQPARDADEIARDSAGELAGRAPVGSGSDARVKSVRYLTVQYGRRAVLTGTLRNSRLRKPLAHATIVIEQQVVGSSAIAVVGRTKTNRKGVYTYRVGKGANRTVIAVYRGTRRLRGAQVDVGEHVRGKATIQVTGTLTPGHSVDVEGKLAGGFIPARGALVTIQYAVKGFRGWTNWGDTRTNARGAFNVHMPILQADARYHFEWRAIIPAQTGWAYLAGRSNTVTRDIS
jgi:hypothetical protein